MQTVDLTKATGRTFPARRTTRNMVGGASPLQATNFALGVVVLEPNGGQVPWHNHEQEEVYFIMEGEAEMCIGSERQTLLANQAVYIPSMEFHQLTNRSDNPVKMLYCYGPAGNVDHWMQELSGTLPKAGVDVPALPEGAWQQCTDAPESD
jgi:mannose-6-phosphate isomerase-like protein (cupin superfamily)